MRVVFEELVAERPVVVARFTTPIEAAIARGALEREGIEAELRDDALVGVAWHLSNAVGGVKLVVRPRDAAQAIQLLADLREQPPAVDTEAGGPDNAPTFPEPRQTNGTKSLRATALSLSLLALVVVLALLRWR